MCERERESRREREPEREFWNNTSTTDFNFDHVVRTTLALIFLLLKAIKIQISDVVLDPGRKMCWSSHVAGYNPNDQMLKRERERDGKSLICLLLQENIVCNSELKIGTCTFFTRHTHTPHPQFPHEMTKHRKNPSDSMFEHFYADPMRTARYSSQSLLSQLDSLSRHTVPINKT